MRNMVQNLPEGHTGREAFHPGRHVCWVPAWYLLGSDPPFLLLRPDFPLPTVPDDPTPGGTHSALSLRPTYLKHGRQVKESFIQPDSLQPHANLRLGKG